jgi:hypothetical protein
MANPVILNNSGDDDYKFVSRNWISNPVKCKLLKIILADESQLSQILTITSFTSTGGQDVRKFSFGKYVNSIDKNNLIIQIPLNPVLILDGQTKFKLSIPAYSQVTMMFFYDHSIL